MRNNGQLLVSLSNYGRQSVANDNGHTENPMFADSVRDNQLHSGTKISIDYIPLLTE